jgi:hypothetical protein
MKIKMRLLDFYFLLLALTVRPTPVKRDREGRDDGSSELENSRKRVRAKRNEEVRVENLKRISVIEEVLDNSNFTAAVDIIIPRIEDWFVQKTVEPKFHCHNRCEQYL